MAVFPYNMRAKAPRRNPPCRSSLALRHRPPVLIFPTSRAIRLPRASFCSLSASAIRRMTSPRLEPAPSAKPSACAATDHQGIVYSSSVQPYTGPGSDPSRDSGIPPLLRGVLRVHVEEEPPHPIVPRAKPNRVKSSSVVIIALGTETVPERLFTTSRKGKCSAG